MSSETRVILFTPTEAIEKWNTRPVEAELREALKPFAEFAEHWDAYPPGGAVNSSDARITLSRMGTTVGHR